MAAWDADIDLNEWTLEDEQAERDIQSILLPEIEKQLLHDLYYREFYQEIEKSKLYVKEKRRGKGTRKSKGNVEAQRARYRERQKIKKILLDEM